MACNIHVPDEHKDILAAVISYIKLMKTKHSGDVRVFQSIALQKPDFFR